jgi:hypothetical protein
MTAKPSAGELAELAAAVRWVNSGCDLAESEGFLFNEAANAYFKAAKTSDPQHWMEAALLAQQHRNALTASRSTPQTGVDVREALEPFDHILDPLSYLRGIRDGNIDPTMENLRGALSATLAVAPSVPGVERITPTQRAELALFGKERGTHDGNDERDLYAISRATLARTIAEAEQAILALIEQPARPEGFKRPVAFRVPRTDPETAGETLSKTEWRLFIDEEAAREAAYALGTDYQGLYVRDGRANAPSEFDIDLLRQRDMLKHELELAHNWIAEHRDAALIEQPDNAALSSQQCTCAALGKKNIPHARNCPAVSSRERKGEA